MFCGFVSIDQEKKNQKFFAHSKYAFKNLPQPHCRVSHTLIYEWQLATISTYPTTYWFSLFGALHFWGLAHFPTNTRLFERNRDWYWAVMCWASWLSLTVCNISLRPNETLSLTRYQLQVFLLFFLPWSHKILWALIAGEHSEIL